MDANFLEIENKKSTDVSRECKKRGSKMTDSLNMEALRRPLAARISSGITIFFFTFVFYMSPFGRAVAQELENSPETIVLTGTPDQKMNQGLLKLQEISKKKKKKIDDRIEEDAASSGAISNVIDGIASVFGLGGLSPEDIDDLQQLSILLNEQHVQALENFSKVEADLIAKQLPEVILQRHRDTVAKYQSSYNEMHEKLAAVLQSKDLEEQQGAVNDLDATMSKHKLKKTHQKTDPNNLPWGSPDARKTRKPGETPAQLSQLTGIPNHPQPILVAANVITPEMLGQPGGPVAEDLTETPDIQFTDAIRSQALELNEDPVEIYNWVRNNIEFIPSYGSIQGANYTLEHGKGNAFDTASLLIALLRASNIPARYAYGSVEIPVDQVMNWVGGVDVPEAAQQLLGQGGIPNVALVNGGKITHIRMETVWAEAWVDYFPSRGAKHVTGDQWIPLDASFKQYEFIEGLDISSEVPFDVQALANQVNEGATSSDSEGWVQGINLNNVDLELHSYQQEIAAFVEGSLQNVTISGALGEQKIILQEYLQLAAGLPYKLVARTNNYSQLPRGLRHRFSYTLSEDSYGTAGRSVISFDYPLAELAGKKLAVSFRPTSQSDVDLIKSYLPEPDPVSGQIDPSQIAKSLPGYLINLTAEFTLDGALIDSADVGPMGSELYETLSLWSPSFGESKAVNHPVAGEYRSVGLNLQGTNKEESSALEQEIQSTVRKIEDLAEDGIVNLSKQELVGDMMNAVIHNYFSINDTLDFRSSTANDIVSYRLPSFGIYGSSLQTSYWFGVPRGVSFSGLVMDVDHLATMSASKDNSHDKMVGFIKSSGVLASAMEHLVPELMFSTEEAPAEGISAVKALVLAASTGQKIWTIDQSNLEIALSAINLHADIESDIRNSVYAGNVATVHESPVIFANSTATGYLLIDPDTGAGAYKISGGLNGGILEWLDENAYWLGGVAFILGVAGGGFAVAGVLLGIALAIAGIVQFASSNPDPTLLMAYIGLMAAFVIMGALFGGAPIALLGLWLFSFMADGALRAAQDAIDALRNRPMP